MIKVYNKTISEDQYVNLINFCTKNSDKVYLYERSDLTSINENCRIFLEDINPNLIYCKNVEKYIWGGEILKNHHLKEYCFKSDELLNQVILKYSINVESWQQPDLLEDIAFYKDEELLLYIIAHEDFICVNINNKIASSYLIGLIDKLS